MLLATVLFGLLGEAVVLWNHMYWQATAMGAGIAFVTIAVLLPHTAILLRAALLWLAAGIMVATSLSYPSSALYVLMVAAVQASFICVRIQPRIGLLFFAVNLVAGCSHLFHVQSHQELFMLLVTLGSSTVLALQINEVAFKFHQYRRLSIFDEMTGLHNVRYFRYKLRQCYEDRNVLSLSLVLIDLDKFKLVNDRFGHRMGDEVLRKAAQLLQDYAAPATVSRYGGEEFAVILPNTSKDAARDFAERLRIAMESTVLCGVPVTLSCGIAYWERGGMDADALFDAADQALYVAKQSRNCVSVHDGAVIADGGRRDMSAGAAMVAEAAATTDSTQ